MLPLRGQRQQVAFRQPAVDVRRRVGAVGHLPVAPINEVAQERLIGRKANHRGWFSSWKNFWADRATKQQHSGYYSREDAVVAAVAKQAIPRLGASPAPAPAVQGSLDALIQYIDRLERNPVRAKALLDTALTRINARLGEKDPEHGVQRAGIVSTNLTAPFHNHIVRKLQLMDPRQVLTRADVEKRIRLIETTLPDALAISDQSLAADILTTLGDKMTVAGMNRRMAELVERNVPDNVEDAAHTALDANRQALMDAILPWLRGDRPIEECVQEGLADEAIGPLLTEIKDLNQFTEQLEGIREQGANSRRLAEQEANLTRALLTKREQLVERTQQRQVAGAGTFTFGQIEAFVQVRAGVGDDPYGINDLVAERNQLRDTTLPGLQGQLQDRLAQSNQTRVQAIAVIEGQDGIVEQVAALHQQYNDAELAYQQLLEQSTALVDGAAQTELELGQLTLRRVELEKTLLNKQADLQQIEQQRQHVPQDDEQAQNLLLDQARDGIGLEIAAIPDQIDALTQQINERAGRLAQVRTRALPGGLDQRVGAALAHKDDLFAQWGAAVEQEADQRLQAQQQFEARNAAAHGDLDAPIQQAQDTLAAFPNRAVATTAQEISEAAGLGDVAAGVEVATAVRAFRDLDAQRIDLNRQIEKEAPELDAFRELLDLEQAFFGNSLSMEDRLDPFHILGEFKEPTLYSLTLAAFTQDSGEAVVKTQIREETRLLQAIEEARLAEEEIYNQGAPVPQSQVVVDRLADIRRGNNEQAAIALTVAQRDLNALRRDRQDADVQQNLNNPQLIEIARNPRYRDPLARQQPAAALLIQQLFGTEGEDEPDNVAEAFGELEEANQKLVLLGLDVILSLARKGMKGHLLNAPAAFEESVVGPLPLSHDPLADESGDDDDDSDSGSFSPQTVHLSSPKHGDLSFRDQVKSRYGFGGNVSLGDRIKAAAQLSEAENQSEVHDSEHVGVHDVDVDANFDSSSSDGEAEEE